MGANNGTGQPLHFLCARCRRFDRARRWGWKTVRTGLVKPLAASQRGCGGVRVLQKRVQYKCLQCGHVGWTRHKDVLDRPLA